MDNDNHNLSNRHYRNGRNFNNVKWQTELFVAVRTDGMHDAVC